MTEEETANLPPSIQAIEAMREDGAFEDILRALEAVVAHLEHGRLSLDESVAWYELGLSLSHRCSELLQKTELRINTIEDRYAIRSSSAEAWDDQ
jgi:exodeoxyribonuclease VII small subunit